MEMDQEQVDKEVTVQALSQDKDLMMDAAEAEVEIEIGVVSSDHSST